VGREAVEGEAALSAGACLRPSVLNYIAGAIPHRSVRHGHAVLRGERQIRAVAAAYMQGRVQQRLGEMTPARAAFQAARRYAEAGAPDPMPKWPRSAIQRSPPPVHLVNRAGGWAPPLKALKGQWGAVAQTIALSLCF
jgi:hypothetical protein